MNKDLKIINDNRGKKACYLCYSGCRQCIKIRDYLYKNATIYLYRKKDRFDMLGTDEWRTYDNLTYNNRKKTIICSGCGKIIKNNNKKYEYDTKLYCYKCYKEKIIEHNLHDDNHENPIRIKQIKENKIEKIDENTSSIVINGKTVIFDSEDEEKIKKYTWHIEQNRVTTTITRDPKKILYLNRYLMNAGDG